jgi:hypothetical protein
MKTLFRIGLLALAAALAAPSSAPAVTTQIDFDDMPAGTILTNVAGVQFIGGPSVFNPQRVATQSEPHAVHTAGTCGTSGDCPSGAHMLEIRFDTPKRSVGWRVGLDDESAPFEFPVEAELIGYNGAGNPVASDKKNIGDSDYFPITTLVKADSSNADIVRAVLTFGVPGTRRRVNADQLIVSDDSQPVPPAPNPQITVPASGAAFDRIDDIRVSGETNAPAGVRRFCLTVSPTPPSLGAFPEDCNGTGFLDADGDFSGLRAGPFVTGENHITAWVEDRRFRRAARSVPVTVNANDLRVTNMEVTQAIQGRLPVPAPDDNDVEHLADYNGLQLVQGKGTVVRVWTSARLPASGAPVRGVAVHLFGMGPDGRPLPRGPLVPIEGTRDLGGSLSQGLPIAIEAWNDPGTSWTFVLPGDWTNSPGPISLRAVVNPSTAYPRVNECTGCEANNAFTLRNIGFERQRTLHIWPFQAYYTEDGRVVKPPGNFDTDLYGVLQVFRETMAVSPFRLAVHPYRGPLNASSFATDDSLSQSQKSRRLKDLLTRAVDIAGYPGFHTMALMKGKINGLNGDHWSWSSFTVRNYSVANTDRPLTSVAHEMYHSIGFEHAGRACPGAIEGGGAVSWPPDDRGLLHGIGTDIRPAYTRNPLRIFTQGQTDAEGNPIENFDFMSYCTGEGNAWISVTNWIHANGRAPGRRAAPPLGSAQEASEPTIAIDATLGPDGGRIARVTRGGATLTAPEGDGSVRIVARDAAGNVLTDLPVLTRQGHTDPGPAGPAGEADHLAAVIPAANVASVDLLRDGQVLDTRHRSATPPSARLTAPRGGTRVRSGRRLLDVRFAARDADGDALETTLEYSADDGRTFRGVAVGLTGTRFQLPTGLLNRASKARLRLRVSDGWNESTATSRAFRVDGPPPRVAIVSPARGARINADQPLNPEGLAFDDAGRMLTGRALRWFAGRRSLGTGERPATGGLRPGRHTLRLVARDRAGRVGQATARVTIVAVTPQFMELTAPTTLPRSARSVTLRVRSSVAGTFELLRQRFAVDRRSRRLKVRIKPGSTTLVLRPRLRSGRRTATAVLTVSRG